MEKILITGSDGFIGSHLVEKLVREGYKVKAFVLYNSFNLWGWLDDIDEDLKDSIEVVAGDIRDPFGIDAAIKDCDIVECEIEKSGKIVNKVVDQSYQ